MLLLRDRLHCMEGAPARSQGCRAPIVKQRKCEETMLRLVVFMAATLMTSVITQAGGYSTANLLPHCKELDSFCAGYLVAVVDAEDEIVGDGSATKRFCVPKGVEVEQLRSIFVKYADAHPDKQYASAARLARLSLSERYPCR
jgi:Ssp1 endopeptidase immunity protein Rap1a